MGALLCTDGSEDVDGPMDSRVREMRLAKMVENLKRRLEQLKSENEQLEELLRQADARVSGATLRPVLVIRTE